MLADSEELLSTFQGSAGEYRPVEFVVVVVEVGDAVFVFDGAGCVGEVLVEPVDDGIWCAGSFYPVVEGHVYLGCLFVGDFEARLVE